MSIETEINRISANVSGTLSAISEMGGEVPDGATSDDMAAGVRSIPVGAKIDDTTPSSTTTYSSQKIESKLSELNEANAAQNTEIAKKVNDAELAKVAKSGSYNDLTNKPTIPTVPSTLPNPNALTFTGAVNETYDGSAAKSVAIPTVPTTLPNPQPLTINGQHYDGSAAVNITITGGDGGANIDDTTPSTSTTYSSSKIESKLTALNDANAALIEVSKTEPNAENTELWIHPNADEVQLPQINDSVESAQDTWSSKKIAAEVSNKANEKDLAVVAKSGSYNDLTGKPTIPTVPSSLPNPNALTFTGAVNETYDGSAPKSVAIPTVPESLKNPNKLILSGAVTAEYDGSTEVSVEIPAGGSGSYTLPVASPTTLGGVMPAAKTAEMTQAVGVDANGGLWALPGGGAHGLTLGENYDIELIASALIDQENIPSYIEITKKENGEPFEYDGLMLWTDVKSNVTYSRILFNQTSSAYEYNFSHANKDSMSVYIRDRSTMMCAPAGQPVQYMYKQLHADTPGASFFPNAGIQAAAGKFTAVKFPSNGGLSGTFYKVWGLTKK